MKPQQGEAFVAGCGYTGYSLTIHRSPSMQKYDDYRSDACSTPACFCTLMQVPKQSIRSHDCMAITSAPDRMARIEVIVGMNEEHF